MPGSYKLPLNNLLVEHAADIDLKLQIMPLA